jgi:hypothetical protein
MVKFYSYDHDVSFLESLLYGKNESQKIAFQTIFEKLKIKSVIVENNYIDKDYLVDYTSYLARCFSDYPRLCKRMHFFKKEINEESFFKAITNNDTSYIKSLQSSYAGYMVIRPIGMSKIGKTCLETYPYDDEKGNQREFPSCKKYHVNLMGIPLYITSLAFQQQDQNVAMCSSIALWSALQKTGRLFQHTIPTPSEITSYALSHSPHITKFPNNGLSVEQICVCISSVGLTNFLYNPKDEKGIKAVVRAYLNVGIPIIAGITLYNGKYNDPKFHAVTIGGYSYGKKNRDTYSALSPGLFSSKITRLFGHDDQLCPFSKLKFIKGSAEKDNYHLLSTSWLDYVNENGDKKYRVAKIDTLIIPLYHKIRISYNDIEKYIRKLCKNITHSYDTYKNIVFGFDFINIEWDIVLNFSNQFKSDILRRIDLSDSDKIEIVKTNFPKYIWCAKAAIYINSERQEVFELVFDATDIKNGDNLFKIVVYNQKIFRFYVSAYPNLFQNKDLFLNSNISLTP